MSINKALLLKLLVNSIGSNLYKRASRQALVEVDLTPSCVTDPLYPKIKNNSFHVWTKANFQTPWLKGLLKGSLFPYVLLCSLVRQTCTSDESDEYLTLLSVKKGTPDFSVEDAGEMAADFFKTFLGNHTEYSHRELLLIFMGLSWGLIPPEVFSHIKDRNDNIAVIDHGICVPLESMDFSPEMLKELEKLKKELSFPTPEETQQLATSAKAVFASFLEDEEEPSENDQSNTTEEINTTPNEESIVAEKKAPIALKMVSGIAAETTTQESLKKIPTPQELGRAARRSKKNKKNTKRQVSREFEPLNSAEVAVSASHLQSANSKPQKSIPEAIEESLKRAHSESTISSPTTHEAVVDSDIQAVRDSEKANQPFENLSIPDTFPREASLQTIPPLSKGMTRTLGYIRRSGNFVNFFGVGVWSSIVKRFTPTDMTSAWPSFGSVSFNYDNIKVTDSAFYILDWQETDLVNSTSNSVTADGRKSYQYRIEYNPHTCYEAKDANVYLVAYPIEENPDLNQKVMVKFQRTAADDDLESSRLLHFKNIHVLLAVGDRYYGPVKLLEDSANRPYANLQLGAKKGLVPGYIRAKDPTYLISVPETCWSEQGYRFTIFVDLAFTNAMEPKFFDLLSEKDLLLRLSSSIAPTKESQEQFSQWVDNHLATNELFCDDPEIRRARKQKIMLALEQSQNTEQFLDGVVSLASQTIDRRVDDEAFFDALVKKITEDPSLMKRLESHRIVAAQLNVQEEKLAQATARYERISNEIENNLKTAQEKAIKDNKTLLAQNKLLAEDVRKKQEKLGILDEVKDLATTRNKIAEEVSSLQQKRNELENLTSRIDDHLTEAVNNPHKYAFDGALASRLLSAASTWEAGKQNDNFVDRARAIATVKFNPLSGLELADDLVQKVQMYRAYDRDTILNFFILLTQNFLTIFSGPPGVGKTSICEILAHVLGLSYFNHHLTDEQQNLWSSPLGMSRYLPVSVERGWTSKRDFVGYYNPLSKTFESVDPLRREAFAQLDAEKNLKLDKIPFIMLLDEANLSPMEHYWGDFMRLCDKHSKAMSYVALGGNSQYSVPDTLRFVATINNDFTTENLSPRLLDRASIVTLPNLDGQPGVMPTENDICLPVSWQALQDLFGAQDLPDTNNDIRDLLTETYQRFSTLGMPVSMRTQIAIKDYVSVATKLFSSEENPSFTSAVDFAVIQRLFPRINGNGEQYRKQLESLHSFLESNGLGRSSHLLEKLIDTGKASMDWYHFL